MTHFYKKVLVFSLLALTTIFGTDYARAQQLPDSQFEDWSGETFNGEIQNKYWHTSNVEQVGFKFNFAHRETGRSGYCAMVQDQEVGAMGITENAPGYMSLGTGWAYLDGLNVSGATAGTYGGISFTYRPDSVVVWIKRTGSNTAKENYNIVFYSWTGTAKGESYKSKSGGCTAPGSPYNTDEESDIRIALDKNECKTTTPGNQVAEAWIYEKKEYANWTRMAIPIYYRSDDKPEKCNLIFSASNYPNFRANSGLYAGNSLYVDDLELIYSDKIDQLFVGNKQWKAFDPASTEVQTYSVGTATSIPEIYGLRGVGSLTNNRGEKANFPGRRLSSAEMSITKKGAIDGDPMEITVKSDDGKSTRVYKIAFVSKQSNNTRLANITVNGEPLSNFGQAYNAYVTTYNLALPYGTTATPVVAFEKGEDAQQVQLAQASSTTGAATIKVTAQDGSNATYTLNFSVAKLSDNTLSNILVDGESLKGFAPTKTTYTVELPLGTSAAPTVTPVSAYKTGEQTIKVVSNDLTNGCQITVSAPGNATTRTYKLNYKITASTYTKLKDLQVEGYDIDFDPERQAGYFVGLPLGVTKLPKVTAVAGDKYQTLTYDDSGVVDGDGVYKITVTAASGDKLVYKITFATEKSDNYLLKSILLDGVAYEGFNPNVYEYTIPLAIGVSAAPKVTYVQGDEFQTVTQTQSGMVVRLLVKAQNGSTQLYTLTFTTTTSDVCTLKNIFVGGTALSGFNENTLSYDYELPIGTTTLPAITFTKGDEYQTVTPVDLTSGGNGEYKLMVKSNAGTTRTYVINFSVATSSNTNLAMIYVNGTKVTGFSASTLTYNVSLPTGTTSARITWDLGDENQTATLSGEVNMNGSNVIVVKALDGSSKRYTVNLSVAKSTVSTLSAIYVGGSKLADFASSKTDYTYNLPSGVSQPMAVTYDVTDQSATASQRTSGMTTTITVTAESGDQTKYTITFVAAAKSNYAYLDDIQVNGTSIADFDAKTLSYTITLPAGTTSVPAITYTKGDANQTVTEVPVTSLSKTYKLIVSAEDGSATNTYSIRFSVTSGSAATLTGIMIDGKMISGFSASTLEYSVTLPTGTTALPNITCSTSDGTPATVIKGNVNGDTRIILGSMTYTIHFSVAASSNAQLAGIQVDGMDIEDFNADQYAYTYGLPYGTTKVPTVTATAAESGQTVNVLPSSSVTGMATIYVISADKNTTKQYTIQFFLEEAGASTVSTLAGIQVAGVAIPKFSARITEYNYALPRGTESVPEITWTLGEEHQQVVLTKGAIGEPTTLLVTAESGKTTTYTIHFAIEQSSNAQLADIQIDGKSLEGFAAGKYSYNYPLEVGTTDVPAVTWTAGDAYQTISATEPSLTSAMQITVTSEDGKVTNVYKVNFTVAQAGVSTLLDIQVNGTSLADFEPNKFDYNYTLAQGVKTYPAVTFTVNDEYQVVNTISDTENWQEKIVVKAQTGDVSTYVITFSQTESGNAQLSDLKVNGESLVDFAPDSLTYSIVLALGEKTMPEITYVAGDEWQTISMQRGGVGDTTYIYVMSEDGKAYNIYKVYVAATLSTETSLRSISLDGQALAGFFPAKTEYDVELPYGTTALPTIGYETVDEYESVKVVKNGVNGDALIMVSAENGNVTIYTLHFSTAAKEASHNAQLKSIMLGGDALSDFAADKYTYDVELPEHSTTCPAITAEKNEGQSVMIAAPKLDGKATITVTAEDGTTTQTYTLNITVKVAPKSNNCNLKNLKVGGVVVNGFDAAVTEYTYNILASTTTLPEVTYEQAEAFQTVEATPCSGAGDYFVKVTAEDGSVKIYTIHFVVKASENTEITYGAGSGTEPDVNITPTDGGQTITVVLPKEYGNAEINVTAENGDTKTYTIPFTKALSNNTLIDGIMYGTTRLATFNPVVYTYNVELPASTSEWPIVSAFTDDATQSISYVQGAQAEVTVTAEDGVSKKTYTINFSKAALDSDATLATLKLGEQNLALTATQDVVLLEGTIACPKITAVPTSDKAVVSSIEMAQLPGAAKVTVTAENGDTMVYTINIDVVVNSDASLNKLYVNGALVTDWDPATTTYNLALASGVTTEVTYEKKHESQKVMLVNTDSKAQVLVVAEDGSTKTYTINYTHLPSNVATLSDIKLYDGTAFASISGFAASTYTYTQTLTKGTKVVPSVYPVAGAKGQTIVVTYGKIDATTTIVVTAEDGIATNTYTIDFPVTKYDNAQLENIDVPDALDFVYDKSTYDYTITLPYGTTAAPILSWEKAVGEGQSVEYIAAPLYATSKLIVTAEDGTTVHTYTFNFNVAGSSLANELQAVVIDGVGSVALGSASSVDINLPYGSTTLPIQSCVTNFAEQTVWVANNGISKPTTITVTAPGKTDKVYTLNPVVALCPSYLTDIKVNGTSIEGFDPMKFNYIVNVTDAPTSVEATAVAATSTIDRSVDNYKQVQFTVEDEDALYSTVYNVFFYYTNDVIPNMDFENWENVANGLMSNKKTNKPVGWHAPIDAATTSEVSASTTTYNPDETTDYTTQHTSGEKGADLSTVYLTQSADAIPGILSLSEQTISVGKWILSISLGGVSTNSVLTFGDGVTYRNTPDQYKIDVNPIANKNVTGWRILYKANNGGVSALYEGDYNSKNAWQTATKDIEYPDGFVPEILDFIINPANSETLSDLHNKADNLFAYANTNNWFSSEMYADNLRILFNSTLTGLKVNGADATISGNTFSATIDSEFLGEPVLNFAGQVKDQMQSVTWNADYTQADIRNYAEDGSYTDYVLNINRATSTINTLSKLVINGEEQTLSTHMQYQLTSTITPSIMVEAASPRATVGMEQIGRQVVVTVTAENGGTNMYLIDLLSEGNNDPNLAVFDENTGEFTKKHDSQTVDVKTNEVVVTAENGATKTYTITSASGTTSGLLTDLAINGETPATFASTTYAYDGNSSAISFTRKDNEDAVVETLTDAQISLAVAGTHTYIVNLSTTLVDDNADLMAINNEDTLIDGYLAAVDEYTIQGTGFDLEAIPADNRQDISIAYFEGKKTKSSIPGRRKAPGMTRTVGTYHIMVMAADGITSKTYALYIDETLSNNTALAGITLNGELIQTTGTGYTSDHAFSADPAVVYNITMLAENPKLVQPDVPLIEATPAESGQSMVITNNGFSGISSIVVTAEDGTSTAEYSLKINAQKSDNADLNTLAVNGIPVALTAGVYEYNVNIPAPTTHEVTYSAEDNFLTITPTVADDKATIDVLSESHNTNNTYVVNFTVEDEYSDATLRDLTVGGTTVSGFMPTNGDYSCTLLVGTATLPVIKAYKNVDGQIVSITTRGVNDYTDIVVTAEDGVTTKTYSILFNVEQPTDNNLAGISIDYSPIATFVPATHAYNVELDAVPTTVQVTFAHPGQSLISTSVDTDDQTIMVMYSSNGATQAPYIIDYTVRTADISSDALLNGIRLDGTLLTGFVPTTYAYSQELPAGTTTLPEITLDMREGQSVNITNNGVNGQTLIMVTAEDGVTKSYYTIDFSVATPAPSTNAQLSMIYVDGADLTGFVSTTTSYTINLSVGTTMYPALYWLKGEEHQTVSISHVDNVYNIVVTAEDGTTTMTYTVTFNVAQNNNAHLRNILVNGMPLSITGDGYTATNSFAPATYVYELTWGKATTATTATIEVVPEDSHATISAITPLNINGGVLAITVTAEDGVSTSTYTLVSSLDRSTCDTIKMIYVDGAPLADFDASTYAYTYTIPAGSSFPIVDFLAGDPWQTHNRGYRLIDEWNKVDSVIVTAQSGATKTYSVHLTIDKYDVDTLAALYVDAAGLGTANLLSTTGVNYTADAAFSGSNTTYNITWAACMAAPADMAQVITFDYDPTVTKQTVTIDQALTSLDGTMKINVTAQNGNTRTYTINCTRALATDNTLASLTVSGTDYAAFDPAIVNYSETLPVGSPAGVFPEVDYTLASECASAVLTWTKNDYDAVCQIDVTAENGDVKTYKVLFTIERSTDVTLSSILINGMPIFQNGVGYTADFAFTPSITEYNILWNVGTTEMPVIGYSKGDPYQTVVVNPDPVTSLNGDITIIVTAGDGLSQMTYTIHNSLDHFDDNTLQMIYYGVPYVEVPGFNPDSTEYAIELPHGTTEFPVVNYTKRSNEWQIVTENWTTIDERTKVCSLTVQPENALVEPLTYNIRFNIPCSNVTDLVNILVNGQPMATAGAGYTASSAYSNAVDTYTLIWAVGTTTLPVFMAIEGDDYQTVDIAQPATLNSDAVITVKAENGATRTITIHNVLMLSGNSKLSMITLDGRDMEGFNPDITAYTITLNPGVRTYPVIGYEQGDEWQTVSVSTLPAFVPGSTVDATITATAQNGSTTVYTITFKSLLSDNVKLAGILVNDNLVDGWDADVLNYTVNWPIGTTAIPTISFTKADTLQTVTMTPAALTAIDGVVRFDVTAENGSTRTYTLTSVLLHSYCDSLLMIYTGGEPVQGFNPDVTTYNVTLPVGTRTFPAISYDKGDRYQTVDGPVEVFAQSYSAQYTLTVTAEAGNTRTYTINYSVQKSSNTSLQMIYVDHMPLTGFAPETFEYNYVLPNGTTTLPELAWDFGDEWQTIDTITNGVNGDFIISVTAEKGTTASYTVHFSVALSTESRLDAIYADGTIINGYDEDINTYNVVLPYGTTTLPSITFDKKETAQNVVVAANGNEVTLTVTAEDGVSVSVYTLNFTVARSENALLSDLAVDGATVTGFAPETFEYFINLPYGTTELPVVTYTAGDEQQTITLTTSGLNVVVSVTSGSGDNANDYTINFSIDPCPINALADLLVRGQQIEGWNPDTLVYTISYPCGSTTADFAKAEDVTYVKADVTEQVTITMQDEATILVTVTAENGDVRVYVILQEILLSNNSLLADIIIDGVSLKDFMPNTFDYEYFVYEGDLLPTVEAIPQDTTAEVSITMGQVDDFTYIYCTAEDGSESVYTILFAISDMDVQDKAVNGQTRWFHIPGTNQFKAITIRENVKCGLFDASGRLINIQNVPLVNPNCVTTAFDDHGVEYIFTLDENANGAIFDIPELGRNYFYVFFYEDKVKVDSGKFNLVP